MSPYLANSLGDDLESSKDITAENLCRDPCLRSKTFMKLACKWKHAHFTDARAEFGSEGNFNAPATRKVRVPNFALPVAVSSRI